MDSPNLPFKVEEWTDDGRHVFELHALVARLSLAFAVYTTALAERPGRLITIRQGARVVRKSKELPV